MPGRTLKRLSLAAIAVAAIAGAVFAFRPQPVPVDLVTIARGPLTVTVEDEGVTRIRDIYTISAPVAGTVQRSPRQVGDEVVADETILAVIEPTAPGFLDIRTQRVSEAALAAASAAVDLAEVQLRQSETQREFAENDLRRANELARRETISARALDQAKLELASAESAVASARATLEVRRRELASAEASLIQPGSRQNEAASCCITVLSPANGRVLRVIVASEQVVQAGAPLIEVGDPGDLEIAVDFVTRDAVRVEQGAAAIIEGWGGQEGFAAIVQRVEPIAFTKVSALGIEEQRVRVVLDPAEPARIAQRLGHNFRILARIAVWSADDAVLVPLGALFREGDDWAVFVVENGMARLRRIAIGERTARVAMVSDGLAAGETVVLHPSDRVADGVSVAAR